MPSAKCLCGCNQATAETCRMRKVSCPGCGWHFRTSRDLIGMGMPTCHCGSAFEPVCLFDRAYVPGADADMDRAAGLMAEFDLRSENAKKAIRRRRRCKDDSCGALVGKGELYCTRHKGAEMPF